jgi:ATP-dependent helicase/nuclease subunit A
VVDRLAITSDTVLIADYKTNRRDEVPRSYITQLAFYRAVLSRLYPSHTIKAALLWTELPDLMEVSAAALDKALAELTSA